MKSSEGEVDRGGEGKGSSERGVTESKKGSESEGVGMEEEGSKVISRWVVD